MNRMTYVIYIGPEAVEQLKELRDRRIVGLLASRVRGLRENAHLQGRPLADELTGLRSVRAVGQRYRIVYEVQREAGRVTVLTFGIRREGDKQDVYKVAERLRRRGFI